ncbi:MAG: GGDEF domain-containing protein [Spirochaetales bacterium]|nr:GGDEF domain-containing protein [Spirochaetales bacterium]
MHLSKELLKKTALLVLLIILGGCGLSETGYARVTGGRTDMSPLKANSIMRLDGDWEFYPGVFLMPGEVYNAENMSLSPVPGVWDQFPAGQGMGTYRIVLTGLTRGEEYSFYFFEKISAAAYYVNGVFLGRDGIPGNSVNVEKPEYIPSIHSFRADSSRAVLLVHISNYTMKQGGFWESVRFGRTRAVTAYRDRRVILLASIVGAMIIMGLFQIVFFLLNRESRSSLWLSIVIALVALKILITGENLLMRFLPGISQITLIKIATLTVAYMVPAYMMFFHTSFPGLCKPVFLKINTALSTIYGLMVIFLPLPVVQSVFRSYLPIILVNLVYIIAIIIKAVLEKKPGAQWSLAASILVFGFSLNDILYDLHIIQTAYVLDLGLLLFITFQVILNADQYNQAFRELTRLRATLESEVENRTIELQAERNKLEFLARNDALTGLLNRNSSGEIFERETLRFGRTGIPFTVVMIDLDYFKTINDSYGHAAGDFALKQFGKTIRRISRRTDFCFRWGGEEFLILMPDTQEADARIHAESLRQQVAGELVETSGASFYLTISYGISSIYRENEKAVEIVNRADTALYRAKEEGRNRGYIYKKPTVS